MKNTQKPNLERFARTCSLPYGTVRRWHAAGAPIAAGPPEVLRWWRRRFDRGRPPIALIRAASASPGATGKPTATPTPGPARPTAPDPSDGDIEELCERQRQAFARAQTALDAAYASGEADDFELERLHGVVDKAGVALARMEQMALRARPHDPRWVGVNVFEKTWNQVHEGLNERLFAVAAEGSRETLPERWRAATAEMLADPTPCLAPTLVKPAAKASRSKPGTNPVRRSSAKRAATRGSRPL